MLLQPNVVEEFLALHPAVPKTAAQKELKRIAVMGRDALCKGRGPKRWTAAPEVLAEASAADPALAQEIAQREAQLAADLEQLAASASAAAALVQEQKDAKAKARRHPSLRSAVPILRSPSTYTACLRNWCLHCSNKGRECVCAH